MSQNAATNATGHPAMRQDAPPPPDTQPMGRYAPSPRDIQAMRRQVSAMPGQAPIVAAGLAIGILLLAIQLWLLTVALDLYLAGRGNQVWSLALVSGVIFAGGLVVLWFLRRRPHLQVRR
jgi:Family of unknown function (DUF6755)